MVMEGVDTLAYHSGRFLWVRFQILDLCEASSDAAIRAVLEHLPDGLYETYMRMLSKISKSGNRDLARRVIRWTACARRPMKILELREAVAFGMADQSWDADKIPDEKKVLESCCGLIVRDAHSEIRFAHHSVHTFLVSSRLYAEDQNIPPADLDSFFFSLDEAEVLAAEVCARYLCFSDFQSALVPTDPTDKDRSLTINRVFKSGGPVAIPASLGLNKRMYDIPYRIFGVKSDIRVPNIDFAQYVGRKGIRNRPPAAMGQKYALLDYVIEFWPWHTRAATKTLEALEFPTDIYTTVNYTQEESKHRTLWGAAHRSIAAMERPLDRLFATFWMLVMYGTLRFEIRPWGSNQHFGPYGCKGCPIQESEIHGRKPNHGRPYLAKDLPCMSLVHWAAESGHLPLLKAIEPRMWDYCKHEEFHDETLMLACRHGQSDVIKFLNNIYEYDITDGRAIGEICKHGDVDSLRALLCNTQTMSDNELRPAEVRTSMMMRLNRCDFVRDGDVTLDPIGYAASYGHVAMLEFLVDLRGGVEWKEYRSNMNGLHYAAMNGHDGKYIMILRRVL